MIDWRALTGRLRRAAKTEGGPAQAAETTLEAEAGPQRRAPPPLPPLMADRLERIERTALAVYQAHGLPTEPGDYRRGPRAKRWTFLGDGLSHEDRWTEIVDHPPDQGWRHARLEDLGGYEAKPVLARASQLLVRCRWLRGRLYGALPGDPIQDLAAAIDLGAAWREVEPATDPAAKATPPPTSPLKFRPAAPATGRGRKGPKSGS